MGSVNIHVRMYDHQYLLIQLLQQEKVHDPLHIFQKRPDYIPNQLLTGLAVMKFKKFCGKHALFSGIYPIAHKHLQKPILHLFKRQRLVGELCGHHRRLLFYALVQQVQQVIIEHIIVNLLNLPLLLIRQDSSQIFDIYLFQQPLLHSLILRHDALDRSGYIRQITFAGVMQQTGQYQPVRIAPGLCLPGTMNTMLSHGKKSFYMSVPPADQGQSMGNIPNVNLATLRTNRIKMPARICCNAAHRILPLLPLYHPKCSWICCATFSGDSRELSIRI